MNCEWKDGGQGYNVTDAVPVDLDDLPQYSGWIEALLENKHARTFDKDVASALREFGLDKWGTLLGQIRSVENPTIIDADRLFLGENEIAFCYREKLYKASALVAHELYCQVILDAVGPYADSHVVDLGSGYGSITLRIAGQKEHGKSGLLRAT